MEFSHTSINIVKTLMRAQDDTKEWLDVTQDTSKEKSKRSQALTIEEKIVGINIYGTKCV